MAYGQRIKTMPKSLEAMSDREFIDYIEMVSDDHRESGHTATADDYDECWRRLTRLRRLHEESIE